MALIGKIRKNCWFVLIVLGLALAAFILMDMTGSSGPGQGTNLSLGSVAGQKIDYIDFQKTEQAYFKGSTADQFAKKSAIWDFYVEDALLKSQSESLGLSVSKDELLDLQFGANPSPIITQNQWDAANLQSIKATIENGEPMNKEFEAYWFEQEKQIIKSSLQSKLNNIISKSVFTPTWMAEESYTQENTKVDFNYVKIPFDQIDGAGIEVSDADLKSYMATKASQFEVDEETRIVEIVPFTVLPSKEDTAIIIEKMNTLKNEFGLTQNDSTFVLSNGGTMNHLYSSYDQIPAAAQAAISTMNIGESFGPYIESDYYLVSKLIDKKVLPDTVVARHILRSANQADANSFVIAEAFIDSIERVYKNRIESFDSLAIKHSQDPSSGLKGGLLDPFTQNTMVPEFTQACFHYGKPGGLYKVRSQYGIHLIKIEGQTYNNRDPKYRIATVGQPIVPSQETQDLRNDLVNELISANRDMASLREALAAHPDVVVESSPAVKINDYALGSLGTGQNPRDIIKWAFNGSTEIGDVAPDVFRFTDPVKYYDNKYVAVSLKEIVPEGMPTPSSVRGQIETAVLNQKKGEKLKSSLTVSSLEDVASQYSVEVQNAADVSMTNTFIPGLGNEPEVVGTAFDLAEQSVSKAILGNSGVYVIQPLSKQAASTPNNIPMLRTGLSTTTKSQVNFKIIENLKKRAKIVDKRSELF